MAYYKLERVPYLPLGGIATAAVRMCSICNHVVDTMGGPGDVSLCEECTTLIRRGQIKMDRDAVVKAAAETE
jgi:hypothetical protein